MGAFVWTFVLAIPWIHVHGAWPGPAEPLLLGAIAAPLAALILGAAVGSDALLLLGFPLLLLPALLTDGALTGRRVYGLDAWAVTACLLGLYLIAALRAPAGTTADRAARPLAEVSPAGRVVVGLHAALSLGMLWVLVIMPAAGEGLQDAFERSHGAEARTARAVAAGAGVVLWLGTLLTLQLPALVRMVRHEPLAHDPLVRELDGFRMDAMDAQRVRTDLGWAILLGGLCAMALGWIMVR